MYDSLMEISRQHEMYPKTWKAVLEKKAQIMELLQRKGDLVLVACGSSYWLTETNNWCKIENSKSLSSFRLSENGHKKSAGDQFSDAYLFCQDTV